MPLPNTKILPDMWSQHHQPSVETAMSSRVSVLRPLAEAPEAVWPETQPGWDEVLIADVPARIRALADGNTIAPSGQHFDTQGYLVQIAARLVPDLLIGKGDKAHRLRVVHNDEAPGLEGQVMQILAAPHESEAFNRDLYAQVHTTQQG